MIHIKKLKFFHAGRYVVFDDGIREKQIGRIKRWNDTWIFVVYKCGEDWEDFKDYTACATKPEDLDFCQRGATL